MYRMKTIVVKVLKKEKSGFYSRLLVHLKNMCTEKILGLLKLCTGCFIFVCFKGFSFMSERTKMAVFTYICPSPLSP